MKIQDMGANEKEQARGLPTLVAELRNALTPTLGYLDLVLQSDQKNRSAAQLQWIDSIERQLQNLQGLSEELIEACSQWRRSDPPDAPK
jgi:signal transduction histidine kinase